MALPLSDKTAIADLVRVCAQKGISRAVISPGSRNAPLIISLGNEEAIQCYSIPDERTAAFVALGMARHDGMPVILTCTSGTAALNYAPAIAEAYYQNVPLLILTADRPEEWTDQADGQTIRQHGLFENYIKASFQMPQEVQSDSDRWYAQRIASEAIESALEGATGPVHINLPLREPLYGTAAADGSQKVIRKPATETRLSESALDALINTWQSVERKLVLTGTLPPNKAVESQLNELAAHNDVAVLTESTSNLHGDRFLPCIDRLVFALEDNPAAAFAPDLLITFGGQVVSKKVKVLLRQYRPKHHWHISPSWPHPDTYQSLTESMVMDPETFFGQLLPRLPQVDSIYYQTWQERHDLITERHKDFMLSCPWSDLKAFEYILNALPTDSELHLGNSTPVRYAQLFRAGRQVPHFANRGTAGIDGCSSTAIGACMAGGKLSTIITGDLSFFYDSNAFWHEHVPNNFRCVVINNGGGGIFRVIPGPATSGHLEEFFETKQNYRIEGIAQAYGLNYFRSGGEDMQTVLEQFFASSDKAAILEIDTQAEKNDEVLKAYMAELRHGLEH